jgi:recombination protein RecR
MSTLPQAIQDLIDQLRKLPGVGYKTAERYAFELLNWENDELAKLSSSIVDFKNKISLCPCCHCLVDEACFFCHNPRRNQSIICVIEKPFDVFNFEKMQTFSGVYHSIGGLLNPLSQKSESKLFIQSLLDRIDPTIEEVIIALDATLEGEATTLLLQERLKDKPVVVSRLAYGIPVGSPLNYVDGSTLSRALSLRSKLL